ncbi:MAG: Gfo/Idh/MocA family protein [Planctomycetota bacterium]
MSESQQLDPNNKPGEPSRREFLLKSALFAASAGALASCSGPRPLGAVHGALPKARASTRQALAPNETIKIGVIGPGGMGSGHCEAFTTLAKNGKEKVQVVALSDVCKSRMMRARDDIVRVQGGTVDTYSDFYDLLKRDDLHGVLIATPEHWHGPMAEAAIAAGKDVYVEKPMTLRLPEALRLYQVAKANPDIRVQVGTQMIMLPKYRKAKELVAQGAIGKPTSSQTSYCRNSKDGEWLYYEMRKEWVPGENLDWERWCGPLGVQPWDPAVYARWRRYKMYSTGIIGDLLVHVMTPMVMALDLGWPTRVVASGGHYVDKAMENHDQININVEFEGQHTMIVAGSTCNENGLETLIRGHKGNLSLGGRHCVVRPEPKYSEEVEERTVECEDIGNDQDMLRLNWLHAIRTREQNASPVELGTKVMVIVDLATRSMWDGKAYAFSPASMTALPV